MINEVMKYSLADNSKNEIIKKIDVALIGLGPHAKRIYLPYLKKRRIHLPLVVEVESKEEETKRILWESGFKKTQVLTLKDKDKDATHLPNYFKKQLEFVCKLYEITHMIVSTEPKAHNMYIEYALMHKISVLTDKPITVMKNMKTISQIEKVKKEYQRLNKLSIKNKTNCVVMCQRQYHKGYEYIKKLLKGIVNQYGIPITYVDIYHCDGAWEFPHDMEKENHPYKYGYGKLFHSGYHFIDFLSDLIKINNQLPTSKQIEQCEIYSNYLTPNDEANIINIKDYKRLFKNQKIPTYYEDVTTPEFNHYGEKNYYGLMEFKNKDNQTVMNVNLNLLHNGFSRRGWIETKNFYKENGRVRHERLNIQVGPLLNIQVHSYQSKEIKDRQDLNREEMSGGLEHFDIEIYRNVDIIGGKPYEKIKLGDLYTEKEKKNMLGYNELAREKLLSEFFKFNYEKGNLQNQALTIDILTNCAKGLVYVYKGEKHIEEIHNITKSAYIFEITQLKKYAIKYRGTKECIKMETFEGQKFSYGIIMNYIKEKKKYEVYLYIKDRNIVVSSLFNKLFQRKAIAILYYYILRKIMRLDSPYKIQYFLQHKKNTK